LIIGVFYVVIDTQMIIHRTENGIYDVFSDAKHLLLDLFKIFIEIIKLLSKEEKKKK
jgi:FtsH-binding integral membrane protein